MRGLRDKFIVLKAKGPKDKTVIVGETIHQDMAISKADATYELEKVDRVIVVEVDFNKTFNDSVFNIIYKRERTCKHTEALQWTYSPSFNTIDAMCPTCGLIFHTRPATHTDPIQPAPKQSIQPNVDTIQVKVV